MDSYDIRTGNIEKLQKQLDRGVKIDQLHDHYENLNRNRAGFTPLHFACRWGGIEVIKFLVSHDHPINCCTETYKETPIISALQRLRDRESDASKVIEIIDYLYSKGADINHKSGKYSYYKEGVNECTESLLSHVNQSHFECTDIIRHLLQLGIRSDIRKEFRETMFIIVPVLDVLDEYDKKKTTLFELLWPILFEKEKKNIKKQRIK